MYINTVLSINGPQIQLAMIASELKTVVFTLSVAFLTGLLTFLLYRRFPALGNFFRNLSAQTRAMLFPQRREARLHKVICPHCKVGMGVLNPVYRTYEGISYIEGNCNTCGSFISARLR